MSFIVFEETERDLWQVLSSQFCECRKLRVHIRETINGTYASALQHFLAALSSLPNCMSCNTSDVSHKASPCLNTTDCHTGKPNVGIWMRGRYLCSLLEETVRASFQQLQHHTTHSGIQRASDQTSHWVLVILARRDAQGGDQAVGAMAPSGSSQHHYQVGGTFERGYYEPSRKPVNDLTLATPRGQGSRFALLGLAVAFASLEQRTWKRLE